MNPRDKYLATRRLPWKLGLQILKVILATAQLCSFANLRYAHVDYYQDQTITFEHLFLKDWDPAREIQTYPDSLGRYALFRQSDFYDFVDFTVFNLARLEEDAIGPFFRNSSLGLCMQHMAAVNISRHMNIFVDPDRKTSCLSLSEQEIVTFTSSRSWLASSPLATLGWAAMDQLYLNFSLTTVSLSSLGPNPACFLFNLRVEMDSSGRDGQLPIRLVVEPMRLDCPGDMEVISSYCQFEVCLNLVVILACLASLLLCLRALLRGNLLQCQAATVLHARYGWRLTLGERLRFVNFWYLMICVNDCLIILGSVLKQLIESKAIGAGYLVNGAKVDMWDMWDVCRCSIISQSSLSILCSPCNFLHV